MPSIAIVIALAAALGVWLYLTRSTYHLETVKDGVLYRSGLQSYREFENGVRRVKPKTVVSLVDDRELADPEKPQFKREVDEASTASSTFKVIRVPVKLGGWPAGDDLIHFLAIVEDPAKQPVLVHCAQGVRRTGMMVAAYQLSVLGYDKERAKQELLTFGHSDRTVNDVKRFIDVYDPKSRRMTTSLEDSKE